MRVTRIVWLGAAAALVVAALVAIAAILTGSFDDTDGRVPRRGEPPERRR